MGRREEREYLRSRDSNFATSDEQRVTDSESLLPHDH
jgi:hypothetical protein